jgi:FdhD protein
MKLLATPAVRLPVLGPGAGDRALPEETPVAIVLNGTTQAVMMATPADLADFATGFALTEGLAPLPEIGEIEIVEHGQGIECRLWLPPARAAALSERRRAMTGPVGCGLCGIDSLAQALRPLPVLRDTALTLSGADIALALDELRDWQPLHDETRATHAAGFFRPGAGILLAREDVGRHNALDKLIGALARAGLDPASGAIALTSRLSTEMVQKTVMAGCPVLLAVSSPTAHAVRLAGAARLTLASRARGETAVFTHPHRIREVPHVA